MTLCVGRLNAEGEQRDRDLSKLSEVVRQAAEGAKEGIVLSEFGTETEGGQFIYEITGSVGSECFEIEVTPDGKVLEIEECD